LQIIIHRLEINEFEGVLDREIRSTSDGIIAQFFHLPQSLHCHCSMLPHQGYKHRGVTDPESFLGLVPQCSSTRLPVAQLSFGPWLPAIGHSAAGKFEPQW